MVKDEFFAFSSICDWFIFLEDLTLNVCLYTDGHEKVARLPFCTCPCDILSAVSKFTA